MSDPYSTSVAKELSAAIARRLGVDDPPDAWRAFAAQVANETANGDPSTRGVRNNNPLNLTTAGGTITWPGQIGEDGPFAVFASRGAGINAAAANYTAGLYPGVLAAFQVGDPHALAQAIQESPWDAGHYSGTLAMSVDGGASAALLPSSSTPSAPSDPVPSSPAMSGPSLPRLPSIGGIVGNVATGAALGIAPFIVVALVVVVVLFAVLDS